MCANHFGEYSAKCARTSIIRAHIRLKLGVTIVGLAGEIYGEMLMCAVRPSIKRYKTHYEISV